MNYKIVIKKSVEKELDLLPEPVYEKIIKKLLKLSQEPRTRGCKKLSAKNEYRIRVGDYRILYKIIDSDAQIEIVAVGHRREVYR